MEQLKVGDHACVVYNDREEQLAAVVPFLRIGLERRERCLYLADDMTAEGVLKAGRRAGLDVDAAIASGTLTIADARSAYLRRGVFDPDSMSAFLAEIVETARSRATSAIPTSGAIGSDMLTSFG